MTPEQRLQTVKEQKEKKGSPQAPKKIAFELGWAALSATHGQRRARPHWAGLGLRLSWAELSATHGQRRVAPHWTGLGLDLGWAELGWA